MLRHFFLFVIAIFFALCVQNSHALQMDDLAVGRIAIDNQSVANQKSAGQQAFAQVLVKLSGQRAPLENDVLATAAKNFEQYLVSSSFLQVDGQLVYQASFNVSKVLDLLKYAGQAIWGERRPRGLLWLAIETPEGNKALATQNDAFPILQIINQSSFARGISLNMPIGDLDDTANVSFYDVWGQFISLMYQHSQRYTPEYVIAAKLYFNDDPLSDAQGWHLQWTMSNGTAVQSGALTAETQAAAIIELIEQYADQLANNYAIKPEQLTQKQQVRMQIQGVNNLEIYAKVMDLLASVSVISDVTLVQQDGPVSSLELSVNVAIETLYQIISLERRLRTNMHVDVVTSSARISGETPVLVYQWVGD